MAARYRKVYSRLWHHAAFQPLADADKVLALYLLTGPQTNRIGYFRLSLGEAVEDLGNTPRTLREGLRNVSQAFDWRFDDASRVLLIPSWWEWNQPENSNVLKGCLKDLPEVPASALLPLFLQALAPMLEAHKTTLPKGYENVPKTFAERTPIQEQEQEQEQEPKPEGSFTAPEGFAEFQSHYPRGPHVGTFSHALKVWKKLPAADRAACLAALPFQSTSEQFTKEGGKFVPTPQKYLAERYWERDYAPAHSSIRPPRAAEAFGWCDHTPRCGTRAGHELKLQRENVLMGASA